MDVCCECCVLSGRGLRNCPITRPEESCRLCCVVVCDLETSWRRRPWATGGCCAKKKLLQASDSDVITTLQQIMLHLCFMSLLVTTHLRHYSSPIIFVLFVYCHQRFIGPGWTCTDATCDVTLGIRMELEVIPD
jgi:hypothetical protein